MGDTNYRTNQKKHTVKKRSGIIAATVILLAGLISAGVLYSRFVTQTIYQESVSHLTEIVHQSNTMLNELVYKNLTYLHLCSEHLQGTSGEKETQEFVNMMQQEAGCSGFYFLSSDGKYVTAAGETGYLGLQGDPADQIAAGSDFIMNAVLPGKPQMLVFACPKEHGSYRGFAYDAIAITYYNSDIKNMLAVPAFDGKAGSYVIHSDGRIVINRTMGEGEPIYNFLAALRERSDLSEKEILALSREFQQEQSGARTVTAGGTKFYLLYQKSGIQDWITVGMVPADIVNANMNTLQISTIIIEGIILAGIAAFIIGLILRRSSVNLRQKDTEILYREELFQKLSMNVDDVFLMLDAETAQADYVSPNAGELLGITAEQIRQNTHVLAELNPLETTEQVKKYLEGLAPDEQREWDFEYIHRKTGERRWFHVIAMGSDVEDRRKYILVMSDRTADKQVNQALSEAVRAAETANRAKSAFLSNMSHDIRTPMNAIIGFATLAAGNVENKERVRDYLDKILASGNHLLSLINDILDMSRIESGKIHLEETEVNLSEVLHNLKSIVSGQVRAKQLELSVDAINVSDEDVYCDKTRLNQVLLNLMSNAIKFTPAGGTVSVQLRQLPSSQSGRAVYEIRVKDNGIGMSPEFAQRIFDPFERERTSTVSRIQGTGLGMAITKSIVDMMGGTIEIRTEPDKGAEFIIRVALRLQTELRREERIAELAGWKALVAGEDFDTCDSVTKMLIRTGMRAEWTLSGKEAVLRARQSIELGDEFRVCFIDWRLPDMTGGEAAREIRSLGDKTTIIALTDDDWSEIEAEAKAAGVTAICPKPIFLSDLHRSLTTVLGQRQSETARPAFPKDSPDFCGSRVLLTEDNELNREIAAEILKEYGFVVETAENGAEAVEKIRASKPGDYDLVLMDVQMPVMDGYDATREIRALPDPALAGIPILAMTANAFDEDRRSALECGMDGFLSKPIVIAELVHELQRLL